MVAAKSRPMRSLIARAPKPPGFHTTTREPKRAHLRVPVFKNTTKIQRKGPTREGEKNKNCGGRGKKKSEILGGPAEGVRQRVVQTNNHTTIEPQSQQQTTTNYHNTTQQHTPTHSNNTEQHRTTHNTQQHKEVKNKQHRTLTHTKTNHNTTTQKNGLAKNGLAKIGLAKIASPLTTNFQFWPKMEWPKLAGQTRWPKMDWPKLATTVTSTVTTTDSLKARTQQAIQNGTMTELALLKSGNLMN